MLEHDTPKFKNIIRIPGAQFETQQLVFAITRDEERGRPNSRTGIRCSALSILRSDIPPTQESPVVTGDV